jgi:ectoine hydroxylase-related dioxygenase (phytanoyl-CoA dioxygenase family)
MGVLERLYDGAVVCERGDTCRVFSPCSSALTTPPHQDYYYVRGDTRLWTAWIPLGDCPRELGGLAVLPGSQRHGLAPLAGEGSGKQGGDVDAAVTWMTTDFACGDVLMFSCLTTHRALENRTPDRLRVSADFRYVPASLA